jgi:hypothetical protein
MSPCGPRGLSESGPLVRVPCETPSASSVDLAPPSARQPSPWISRLIRLSWVSPAVAPSSVRSSERPLPVGVATFHRCAGSTRCTSRSALVDFHHLDGFLRSEGPGMLQPGPDRVRCVSRRALSCTPASWTRGSPLRVAERHTPFPATRLVPFEAFPSSAAVPHHCGHCPPAVVVPHPCRDAPRRAGSEVVRDADAPERSSTASDVRGPSTSFVQRVHSRCTVSGAQAGSLHVNLTEARYVLSPPMRFALSSLLLPAGCAVPKHHTTTAPKDDRCCAISRGR